jgi:hypothetical protein
MMPKRNAWLCGLLVLSVLTTAVALFALWVLIPVFFKDTLLGMGALKDAARRVWLLPTICLPLMADAALVAAAESREVPWIAPRQI